VLRGTLTLSVPAALSEGAFAETRIALVDVGANKIYRQHEWFEIYDTRPPQISNYSAVLLQNHRIAIQALVGEAES
jgi:hypothetical protein